MSWRDIILDSMGYESLPCLSLSEFFKMFHAVVQLFFGVSLDSSVKKTHQIGTTTNLNLYVLYATCSKVVFACPMCCYLTWWHPSLTILRPGWNGGEFWEWVGNVGHTALTSLNYPALTAPFGGRVHQIELERTNYPLEYFISRAGLFSEQCQILCCTLPYLEEEYHNCEWGIWCTIRFRI